MAPELIVGVSAVAGLLGGFLLGRLTAPLRRFTKREMEAHLSELQPHELSGLVRFLEKKWTISAVPPQAVVIEPKPEDDKGAEPVATASPDRAR